MNVMALLRYGFPGSVVEAWRKRGYVTLSLLQEWVVARHDLFGRDADIREPSFLHLD